MKVGQTIVFQLRRRTDNVGVVSLSLSKVVNDGSMEQPGPAIAHKRQGAGTAIILTGRRCPDSFLLPGLPGRDSGVATERPAAFGRRSLTADPLVAE
jgi:hypothetical protein